LRDFPFSLKISSFFCISCKCSSSLQKHDAEEVAEEEEADDAEESAEESAADDAEEAEEERRADSVSRIFIWNGVCCFSLQCRRSDRLQPFLLQHYPRDAASTSGDPSALL
jgi:hypothetical protein